MRYTHDGLTLWYGTDDAPAPAGVVDSADNLSVVAGVFPPNPSNTVSLLYRVEKGLEHTVRATRLSTDYGTGHQYFKASFPKLTPGSKVEYALIGENAGRRVPDPANWTGLYRQFEVSRIDSSKAKPAPSSHANPSKGRLPFQIEYLSHFTINLGGGPPEIIGETPEGIKVNWYISSGEVAGPKLNGKIRPEGGDWMTIRRDGIGNMDVRATLETTDGALIYIYYIGYFELGEDGYQNFLKKKWPPTPPTRTAPRLSTEDPRYLWVNRLQCFGIGRVIMEIPLFEYDLYGLN